MASADELRDFCDGADANTDDRPVVVVFGRAEIYLPRMAHPMGVCLLCLSGARLIRTNWSRTPPGLTVTVPARVGRLHAARDIYPAGTGGGNRSRMTEAIEGYVESCAPESAFFHSGYARSDDCRATLDSDRQKARRAARTSDRVHRSGPWHGSCWSGCSTSDWLRRTHFVVFFPAGNDRMPAR